MRRAFSLLVVVGFVAGAGVPAGAASSQPTGSISCTTSNNAGSGTLTPALPAQTPSTTPSKFAGGIDFTEGSPFASCDNTAQVGGRALITHALVTITGAIPTGSDCLTEFTPTTDTSHASLARAKISITFDALFPNAQGVPQWQRVGKSKARLASVTVDTNPVYGLEFETPPIRAGAFKGDEVTVEVYFTDSSFQTLFDECTSPTGSVSLMVFQTATLTVAPPT
jgi:hypothetical protein